MLVEDAKINYCTDSRVFDGVGWTTSGSTTPTRNETGIDRVENTATTLTDDTDLGIESVRFFLAATIGQTNWGRVFIKKETGTITSYPGFGVFFSDGTERAFYTIDTVNGLITDRTDVANSGTRSTVIIDRGDFWEVVVTLTSTVGATFGVILFPSIAVTYTSIWNILAMGSVVADQIDIRLNQTVIDSPIFTSGATVSTDASVNSVATPSNLYPLSGSTGAVRVKVTPSETGQTGAYIFGSGVDGDEVLVKFDAATVTVLARTGTVLIANLSQAYTHTVDIAAIVDVYWDSDTKAIGVRAFNDGDAEPVFATDTSPDVFTIGATTNIGNLRAASNLCTGLYANNGLPKTWASAEDAGWL